MGDEFSDDSDEGDEGEGVIDGSRSVRSVRSSSVKDREKSNSQQRIRDRAQSAEAKGLEEPKSPRNSLIDMTAHNLIHLQNIYANLKENNNNINTRDNNNINSNVKKEQENEDSKTNDNEEILNSNNNNNNNSNRQHVRKQSKPDGSDNMNIREAIRRLREKESLNAIDKEVNITVKQIHLLVKNMHQKLC